MQGWPAVAPASIRGRLVRIAGGRRRFAEVEDYLVDHGLAVVMTGSADEAGVVHAVANLMRPGARPGGTNGTRRTRNAVPARLVVTNDTGASHVAAAVRVPSVVVIGSAEPERWAPLDRYLHSVVVGVRPGMADVYAVVKAIDEQLERWPGVGGGPASRKG